MRTPKRFANAQPAFARPSPHHTGEEQLFGRAGDGKIERVPEEPEGRDGEQRGRGEKVCHAQSARDGHQAETHPCPEAGDEPTRAEHLEGCAR